MCAPPIGAVKRRGACQLRDYRRLMLAATALISTAGIARLLPFAGLSPAGLQTFIIGMLIADLFSFFS